MPARGTDTIEHRVFHDLPALLQAGDLLVINNSKVLPARLIGHKEPTGAVCELLLLRQVSGDVECLAKARQASETGAQVVFGDGTLKAQIEHTSEEDGNKLVRFFLRHANFV